jgi:hypothetical protein
MMKIYLTKLTPERHALEIVRRDGSRDRVELETKSLWLHDFLHFAIETEAGLQDGFWGSLAAGKTMAQMNPTSSREARDYVGQASPNMMEIEQTVGMLTGAAKGRGAREMYEGYRMMREAQGEKPAAWITPEFIERVQERMRQLVGHWNGTPFGAAMAIEWSE